ncbi:hypothetical protein GE061_004570 [Apolygus lucorum]|uniref:Uncharacterized protein n=1 Tax=Apolygus lucorum TaxID=248454 RepID=A0A8S9WZJ7_APOLU|nr:hypothetical protein GE061_004570 [Apolygus lucorum]
MKWKRSKKAQAEAKQGNKETSHRNEVGSDDAKIASDDSGSGIREESHLYRPYVGTQEDSPMPCKLKHLPLLLPPASTTCALG